MFLNLKDFAPHSRRGGAVGDTPPRAYRQSPPAFSGCLRLRPQSALLRLLLDKAAEAERFAGD